MTRITPSDYEALMLRWPCAHCHVPVGEWCVTKSGRPCQFLHAPRHYKAAEYKRRSNISDLQAKQRK